MKDVKIHYPGEKWMYLKGNTKVIFLSTLLFSNKIFFLRKPDDCQPWRQERRSRHRWVEVVERKPFVSWYFASHRTVSGRRTLFRFLESSISRTPEAFILICFVLISLCISFKVFINRLMRIYMTHVQIANTIFLLLLEIYLNEELNRTRSQRGENNRDWPEKENAGGR